MRRSIVIHKYTLHFETVSLGLVPCKKSLLYKISIVSLVQFKSFIDFEWFVNGLLDYSSLYCHTTISLLLLLATGMSELDIIHLFAHPSGPSNLTRDSSGKITLGKSIFTYFLAQFRDL